MGTVTDANAGLPPTLDERLQALAELRTLGARWYWLAGDACTEIVSMAEDDRRGRSMLIGQCAAHLGCSREYVRQLMRVSQAFPEGHYARDLTDMDWSLFRAIAQRAATPEERDALLETCIEHDIHSARALTAFLGSQEEPDPGEAMERYRDRLRREFSDPEWGEMRRDVAREVLAEYA